MNSRARPPGTIPADAWASDPEAIGSASAKKDDVWDGYLTAPDEERIGICCSGGGIRSASFSLGALQILRETPGSDEDGSDPILFKAEHLACVSGGAYIGIAHALMTSETTKEAAPPPPPDRDSPATQLIEDSHFGRQAPWAADSPEEQHLRDHSDYLAPGFVGRAWLFLNLLYGMIRHLLPFVAVIYLAAFGTGMAYTHWLGPYLRQEVSSVDRSLGVWVLLFALAVIAGLLLVRDYAERHHKRDVLLARLQAWSLRILGLAGLAAFTLIIVPGALWLLRHRYDTAVKHLAAAGAFKAIGLNSLGAFAVASAAVGAAKFLVKNRKSSWFRVAAAILVWISAPLVVGIPYIGFTYWNTQWGWSEHDPWRFILAGVALVILLILYFADEVTSIPHLFYRGRLASAFVGRRVLISDQLKWEDPPWNVPIRLSKLVHGTTTHARMPNLVVCASANLSKNLPPGRLGASFTFEKDRVGGPMTKYVPMSWMEERAGQDTATLPALMAISGAAVAPSMGKMTVPPLRFLMAMFDLRLGVWLPNPYKEPCSAFPAQVRTRGLPNPAPQGPYTSRKRPGTLYIFREAFGLNGLHRNFIYVSDGGHWENLGLVELLRRGCSKIVCIDGSGGDAKTFGTLSEAIALARADLGVKIDIDLHSMIPDDENGLSDQGYAKGRIEFPNQKLGTLLYIRTVIPCSAPQDLKTYASVNKKFPNDPTSDQLFNERKFESYRALGRHNMQQALLCAGLEPTEIDPCPPCPEGDSK